jgi:hypothetical protein
VIPADPTAPGPLDVGDPVVGSAADRDGSGASEGTEIGPGPGWLISGTARAAAGTPSPPAETATASPVRVATATEASGIRFSRIAAGIVHRTSSRPLAAWAARSKPRSIGLRPTIGRDGHGTGQPGRSPRPLLTAGPIGRSPMARIRP